MHRAAQILHQCREQGNVIDALPAECQPPDIGQAYLAQAAFADLTGQRIVGWKIAATAEAGRQHINVDRPLAGRLFRADVHDDGATVALAANRMGVAEAEFVLMLAADLPVRDTPYTETQVAQAVGAVHPGLEFPDSRFADFTQVGAACLIADNACASQFVLGPASLQPFDPVLLAAQATTLQVNDMVVTRGHGHDALGGPLQALTWLANTLRENDIALRKGQFVTTGVTGSPSPVRAGDRVKTDLGPYGTVQVTLTA